MSNIPISDDLAKAFKEADASTRAILVQNDGGFLKLVQSAPPSGPDVSDKEDFAPVLAKLFANDPQRSGYALYRLDSQSASGEWEWLCCSYQPDGAKIKEKMQYAITRSSLMAGLTERRFLETIFGASPSDFLWPTKLRNSRKHDYQNPQLKTAGVAASEAAGTGSGGARRNFGSAGRTNNLRSTEDEPSNLEATSAVSGVSSAGGSAGASPAVERPQPVPEAELPKVTQAPTPKRYNSHEFTSAFKSPTPPVADQEPAEPAVPVTATESTPSATRDDNAKQFAAEEKAPEEPSTPKVAAGQTDSLSQPTVPSGSTLTAAANVASAIDADEPECKVTEAEQDFAQSKAPQEPSSPSTESKAPLSQPTLPTSLDQASLKEEAPERPQEKSSISIGSGSGPSATGLTQREEELASLRKLQATERAGTNGSSAGSGAGGPAVGFKWDDGVQDAIKALASTASGTSEWNLVVLSIDLRSETVELESPPRFVPPADLPSALSANDPRIAFYRLDKASMQTSGESVVAMLYCCPASSGVKARMIYSSNVLIILNHVKGFSGMRVVKKLEASDREDFTHAYVTGEIEEVLAQERHKFAGTGFDGDAPQTLSKTEGTGFSRPRKAGSTRH
ncbi:Actin-binding, cofilin/tropomyosin type [Kalmanozyma brasiliensis GHG001]|uniref:ADF-H domain-containing protein n=1 Tax=Kalmanozyma brasiliensis (strain GHG001) TaxID=1365824 RepID=V5EPC3_KALBG|nr:Actin-binding, cofilin/tropomyosin type [Kalmanozyma brasiliensis GHG001]EST04788.1 Actin-binding, cofilin/tropomyosin type [Kalmanozyma brasiliensis GHG001]